MTEQYDTLIEVIKRRMSTRKLKPDPLPEGAIEKILEAGRWAMSGANGQPWEYIVITDPPTKRKLYQTYQDELVEYNFWMEMMRLPELRHPAFPRSGDLEEELRKRKESSGWAEAPALIVVLGDGRRQWATVMGGHTMGRHQSHLTDGLANTCMLIHLAAAAMGLGTQWVTIHIEDRFKRVLSVPDVITFYSIIPVGYPDVPPKQGVRRPLAEIVHYNQYDRSKHMSHRQIADYIRELRGKTMPKYVGIIDGKGDIPNS